MSNEAKKNFMKATDVLKDAVCGYLDAFAAVVESTPEITVSTLEVAEGAVAPVKTAPAEKPKKEKKSAKKSKPEPVEEPESDDEETVMGNISADDLEEMSYNDLKKLAAEMGIPAKGDRNTLIKKITAADVEVPVDGGEDDDEEVDEKPTKKSKKSEPKKKSSKKKPEPEPEEEDDDEDDGVDPEDDEAADEVEERVREMCEDMSVEEIADVLSSAGLSTKGKKQALIDRVVKGVKDGLIDIDDEDDDEEPDDDEDYEDDDEDEDYEYELNDTDDPDMSDERREAILALEKKIKKSVKSGKLTTAKMKKALKDYYNGDKESLAVLKDADDELIEELYLDMKFNYIDDDGESHDNEEAYYINETPFCCGVPLEYDEDDEVFTCPHCGEQYPTGDDEDDEDDE